MLVRGRVLLRCVATVMMGGPLIMMRNLTLAGSRDIVPGAGEFTARQHQLDHEEGG